MRDLVKRLRNAPVAWKIRHEAADALDALEAEAKTAGEREAVAWGERDQYLRTNVNLAIEIKDARKRIEALEAAGKRLADAAVRLDADEITSALAAWRAAEGGEDA